MKKLLFFAIAASVFCLKVAAQGDPTVNSVGFASGTVAVGQTTILNIDVTNNDFVNFNTIPAGGYQVSISLPASLVYRSEPLSIAAMSNVSGPLFDNFTFDGQNVFTADLAAPQGVGQVSKLQIVVKGLVVTSGPVLSVVDVVALTAGVSATDNPNNNSLSPGLQVVNVLAVSLTDITSTASDCSAKIAWNTTREDAGSTFDVEYSPDGARFVKVGTVAGRSATGANYEYSYSQGNGKGFYRLKIGAATGGDTYSKVVNVTTKCNEKKVFIYPNPIQNLQDLHVNVTNFFGAVKGDLINSAGQIILTKKLVNGANLVKIANLAEGVYKFKVSYDAKEIQNFKIVVVK